METRAVFSDHFSRTCVFGRRPKALIALLLALTLVASLAFGASAALAAGPATIVDAGFESGADGAALSPSAWTLSGTPSAPSTTPRRPRTASLSGWIAGPAAAGVAGVSTPVVMTSDGSEYRFWVYADSANENRYVSDTGSVFELRTRHAPARCSSTPSAPRPATRPTPTPPVGTYAAGWTEYRIVLDFTAETYTLSKRTNATDAWTQLKSATALHLRHPHARGHRPHHHGQPALPRLHRRRPVGRRRRLRRRRHRRRRHHAAGRTGHALWPPTTPQTPAARSTCPGPPRPTTSA